MVSHLGLLFLTVLVDDTLFRVFWSLHLMVISFCYMHRISTPMTCTQFSGTPWHPTESGMWLPRV